jgi:hypothetical protein
MNDPANNRVLIFDRPNMIKELPDPWLEWTYLPRNILLNLIGENRYSLNEVVGKMAVEMEAACKQAMAIGALDRPSLITAVQVCEWLRNCGRMLVFRTFAVVSKNWKDHLREGIKVKSLEHDRGLACFRPIIQCVLPQLGPLDPVQCALQLGPGPDGREAMGVIPVGYEVYRKKYEGTLEDLGAHEVGPEIRMPTDKDNI